MRSEATNTRALKLRSSSARASYALTSEAANSCRASNRRSCAAASRAAGPWPGRPRGLLNKKLGAAQAGEARKACPAWEGPAEHRASAASVQIAQQFAGNKEHERSEMLRISQQIAAQFAWICAANSVQFARK